MLEIRGEHVFSVAKPDLWALLNDPEVLKQAIPGCNAVERISQDRYRMGLKLQVANVSGEYMGEVAILDRQEPHHYVLAVSGEGSIGFMKEQGVFDLEERAEGGTLLRYTGTAELGGVAAGVGQRVLTGVARFLAGRFFQALEKHVQENSARGGQS